MQKSHVRFPGRTETAPIYMHCAQVALSGYCPVKGGGITARRLDLPPLTPLYVAGCCRLQQGAAHWATWVILLQVVDNSPHIFVVVDSPLGGSWPKKTTLLLDIICIY